MSSPSFNFAQHGAALVQAASAEEREQAVHLLDALINDPDELQVFTERFFGASLVQQSGSPVDSTDTTVNTSPNSVSGSIPSNPGMPLKETITQLLPLINANSAHQSPLLALSEKVESLFKCGPDIAAFIFLQLQLHMKENTYKRTGAIIEISVSSSRETDSSHGQDLSLYWKSCKMATTLVLLFATSDDPVCLHDAIKLQSRGLGGLPTYDSIKKTPSSSLLPAFLRAKKAAQTKQQTTILAVSLVDVHMFELAQRGASEPYSSFDHVFTMGVGPEGAIIWQAWGEHGYQLDTYLEDGHGRVRNWDEADQFVRAFDKLAAQKGTWDAKCNKLYKKLFLIDINQLCGPHGLEKPVTPKFKAWVRIHSLQNITCGDVAKFSWTIE